MLTKDLHWCRPVTLAAGKAGPCTRLGTPSTSLSLASDTTVLYSERKRVKALEEAEARGESFWTEELDPVVRRKLVHAFSQSMQEHHSLILEKTARNMYRDATGDIRSDRLGVALQTYDTDAVLTYVEAISRALRKHEDEDQGRGGSRDLQDETSAFEMPTTFASVLRRAGGRTIRVEVAEMARIPVTIDMLEMYAFTPGSRPTEVDRKNGSAATTATEAARKLPAEKETRGMSTVNSTLSLSFQTMKDAWAYCKATAKTVGRYQWVPGLGALTAVIAAITATTIFANLTEGSVSTAGRIVVGAVTVLSAVVGGLQTWANTRIKDLSTQQGKFHDLHRKIEADLDDRTEPPTEKEKDDWDKELADIKAGMTGPSNREWDKARNEVEKDVCQTPVWRKYFEK